jgi:hypothetical protein
MILNKELVDFFAWGNAFLQRSQLRSLRNLTLYNFGDETSILARLIPGAHFDRQDIHLLFRWADYCRDSKRKLPVIDAGMRYNQIKEYIDANTTERSDPFAGCYFSDGTISGKGMQLRMEAGICKDAK